MSLIQIVCDQIIAEGPQIETAIARQRYVEETINAMTNVELLERISDALPLTELFAGRQGRRLNPARR
jgi:hypothetical protein